MPFDDKQKQFNQARTERRQLEAELTRAKEKIGRTSREKTRVARFSAEEAAKLDEQEKTLGTRADQIRAALEQARLAELEGLEDFLEFSDPREYLTRLDDTIPILLFPLRIETRFITPAPQDAPPIVAPASNRQLWVRVYPDDIAVDSFEPLLSESEARDAASYLVSLWAACGDEGLERAAWRSLAAGHGSGRAYWISRNYQPLNPGEKPVKANAADIVLIIATDRLPDPAEQDAIKTYWEALLKGEAAAWNDLVDALGDERSLEIQKLYKPVNIPKMPPDNPVITVVFLQLPRASELDTRLQAWSQTPQANILPERLVLLAFNDGQDAPALELIGQPIPSSLAVGPDPSLGEDEQLRIEDGDIVVNAEMRWMVDFEQAVAKGMGFKIDLTGEQANAGFDRMYVLGVRMAADAACGKHELETLFEHHHYSRKGLSLVRQGTPTNNTDKESAGYSWRENTDASFDQYFKKIVPADPLDWTERTDGRGLAFMLGIDPVVLQPVANYFHTDQAEAKAMNTVMWPATAGYFMESMMEPVFDEAVIQQTRDFFIRYVSGRGAIPALRVGKQPYGVLPATPFRRMEWMRRADKGYLLSLYRVLNSMSADWLKMLDGVSRVGKAGDPHQLLLDIVGLHPASVEFYSRNAQSFEQVFNTFVLLGFGNIAAQLTAFYIKSGMELLAAFGYTPKDAEIGTPDILRKIFFDRGDLLKGVLIDTVPLSETEPVRAYTDDGKSYIEWLIDAAETSHDALRRQNGFTGGTPPAALFYLMLHHALDLGYVDACLRLQVSKAGLTPAQMVQARKEPAFIHVRQDEGASRWKSLYQADARITGDAAQLVGDYIPGIIGTSAEARHLREQLAELEKLKGAPTARLDRLFAEHLDLCTYRLDAWILGLVHRQLETMRADQGQTPQGVYLGAYGWLENVRPENKVPLPVVLEPELAEVFADPGHPLTHDQSNGGYIHAPSTNHAVTAAVLRNGYLENSSAANPGSFAVNLSSERVRLALGVIEGMQAGQSLSALLGYRLERGLHDRHDMEVDGIIYDLRLAFPLRANHLKSTVVEDVDSIDTVEARNVVDALALIEHIKKTGNAHYPFGHAKLPVNLSDSQRDAIDAEVDRILNINDAVADLAMAESIHQVAQGNYDRAAATLDSYSKGNFPPIPDVIKTPRSGVTLTHRVGLQLEAGLDPAAVENTTPRAKAEPAVNKWLASVLPDMNGLACRVEFTAQGGAARSEPITLAMLGFEPIDALYMVSLESSQAMTLLDDAIVLYALESFDAAIDSDIRIIYTEPIAGKLSLHETAPLLRSLKALVQRSRPLNGGDVALMNEATREAVKQNIALDKKRIALNRTGLGDLKDELETFVDTLSLLLTPQDAGLLMPEIDGMMRDLSLLLQALSMYGLPQTGSGFIWQWQQTRFRVVAERLGTLMQRLQEKLDGFDAAMLEYAGLPGTATDEERFTLLQTAERFISTARTDISGMVPEDFHDDLLATYRPAFEQVMDDTRSARASASLADFYAALTGIAASLPDVDTAPFDLSQEHKLLLTFAADLLARGQSVNDDLKIRLDAVDALLTLHDNAADAPEKVNALLAAAKHLFGEDFTMIPEFSLTAIQADEWQNAYDQRAGLLSYQVNTMGEDFPVDNWLYGAARVREKIGHVENAILMTEILAQKNIALEPIQLPYRANDSWLALEYSDTCCIDEDKLLYTAHYCVPFDGSRSQCGLLLDEWTEVIPGKNETTGLAFHYDRPNSEPPQALLLATPADFSGQWKWKDLVDTLHDTLDLAKKRAVGPEQIDGTAYARFLPALVSAFTVYPITASLNLALNNRFYQLKETPDE